jgi:hypothetical protein
MKRIILLLGGAASLIAMFMSGIPVPLDRLISNTESVVRKDPKNAGPYYLLGRLHSLAFATYEKKEVESYDPTVTTKDGLPLLGHSVPERGQREGGGHLQKTDIDHANASLENYQRAVELEPTSPLYHFSLGWMDEQCSRFADQLGRRPATTWIDLALAEYRAAYRLALPIDLKVASQLDPFIADQAGSAIIEILKKRGGEDNQSEMAEIAKNVDVLRKKPLSITPVIFSMHQSARLEDLISDHRVPFDLDGFNEGRSWTWVRPETCILVWDPNRTGRITSGRQLFGTVTWWMFWQNGYEPLAALDDNRDGVLSGAELKGIGVWCDTNSNGVSDPGEVVPVESLGIVEIGVRPELVGGVLLHKTGIRLKDGTSRTTFDWAPSGKPTS